MYAFIGTSVNQEHMRDIERQIQILKAAGLVEKIGNQPITKDVVLQAIQTLNDECQERLHTTKDVVPLYSIDHKKTKFAGKKIYCEDAALTIPNPGTSFLAIVLDYDNVEPMSLDVLQEWMDFLASFSKIEDVEAKGPAERRTQQAMIQRQKYARGKVEEVLGVKLQSKM